MGLLPGPKGLLAYAYLSEDDQLLFGIADGKGWRFAPKQLFQGGEQVLALHWTAPGVLEFAYRIMGKKFPYGVRVPLQIGQLCLAEGFSSRTVPNPQQRNVLLAYYQADLGWFFLAEGIHKDSKNGAFSIFRMNERGESTVANELSFPLPVHRIDRSRFGRLMGAAPMSHRLESNGAIVAASDLPAAARGDEGFTMADLSYRFHDASLAPYGGYYLSPGWAYRVDNQDITVEPVDFNGDRTMTIRPLGGELHYIARTESYACGDVIHPIFIPTANGYRLLSPSGCYVEISRTFQRSDPLEMEEHLKRRGSRGWGWNEMSHMGKVCFLRYAGLFVGLIAVVLSRWRRKKASGEEIDRRRSTWQPLAIAALIYIAMAVLSLAQLAPILR